MPPVCCPQCFLLLMNYSCPRPGGRSIMQKGETLAGPSFQLTGSAPAPGKDCPQPSCSGATWAGASSCPQGSRLGVGCKHTLEGELFTTAVPPPPGRPMWPSAQRSHEHLRQPWEQEVLPEDQGARHATASQVPSSGPSSRAQPGGGDPGEPGSLFWL